MFQTRLQINSKIKGPTVREFLQTFIHFLNIRLNKSCLHNLELIGGEVLHCFNKNNFLEFFNSSFPTSSPLDFTLPSPNNKRDFDFRIQLDPEVNKQPMSHVKYAFGETILHFWLPNEKFTDDELHSLVLNKTTLVNQHLFREDEANNKCFSLYTLPLFDGGTLDIKIGNFSAYCLTPADALAINIKKFLYSSESHDLKLCCYHFSFKEYLLSNFTSATKLVPQHLLNPGVFPWILAKILKGSSLDSLEDFRFLQNLYFHDFGQPTFHLEKLLETKILPKCIYYLDKSIENHLPRTSLSYAAFYLQLFCWIWLVAKNDTKEQALETIQNLAQFFTIMRQKMRLESSLDQILFDTIKHLSEHSEDLRLIIAAWASFGFQHTCHALSSKGYTDKIDVSVIFGTPCCVFQLCDSHPISLLMPIALGEDFSKLRLCCIESKSGVLIAQTLMALHEHFPISELMHPPLYEYQESQLNLLGISSESLPEIVNQSLSLPFSHLKKSAHTFASLAILPKKFESVRALLNICLSEHKLSEWYIEKLANLLDCTKENLGVPPALLNHEGESNFDELWWSWLFHSPISELSQYAHDAIFNHKAYTISLSIRSEYIKKVIQNELLNHNWDKALNLFLNQRKGLDLYAYNHIANLFLQSLKQTHVCSLVQFFHTFFARINIDRHCPALANSTSYLYALFDQFKKPPLKHYFKQFLNVLNTSDQDICESEEKFWSTYFAQLFSRKTNLIADKLNEISALSNQGIVQNVSEVIFESFSQLILKIDQTDISEDKHLASRVIHAFQTIGTQLPAIKVKSFLFLMNDCFVKNQHSLAKEVLNVAYRLSIDCTDDIWKIIFDHIPVSSFESGSLDNELHQLICQLLLDFSLPKKFHSHWEIFLPYWWLSHQSSKHPLVTFQQLLTIIPKLRFNDNSTLPAAIFKQLIILSIKRENIEEGKNLYLELNQEITTYHDKQLIDIEWHINALTDMTHLLIRKGERIEKIYSWLTKALGVNFIASNAADMIWDQLWSMLEDDDKPGRRISFIDQQEKYQYVPSLSLQQKQLQFLVDHPDEMTDLTYLKRTVNLYQHLPPEIASDFRQLLQERFFYTFEDLVNRTNHKKIMLGQTIKLYNLLIVFITSHTKHHHSNSQQHWEQRDIQLFNDLLRVSWTFPGYEIKQAPKDKKKYGAKAFLAYMLLLHDMANPLGYSHSNNDEVIKTFFGTFMQYPHWVHAPNSYRDTSTHNFFKNVCSTDKECYFFNSLMKYDRLIEEGEDSYFSERLTFFSAITPMLICYLRSEENLEILVDYLDKFCEKAFLRQNHTKKEINYYQFTCNFIEPIIFWLMDRIENNENQSVPLKKLLEHLITLLSAAAKVHEYLIPNIPHPSPIRFVRLYNQAFQLFIEHQEHTTDLTEPLLDILMTKCPAITLSAHRLKDCIRIINPEHIDGRINSIFYRYAFRSLPLSIAVNEIRYLASSQHKINIKNISISRRCLKVIENLFFPWKGIEIEREAVLSMIRESENQEDN